MNALHYTVEVGGACVAMTSLHGVYAALRNLENEGAIINSVLGAEVKLNVCLTGHASSEYAGSWKVRPPIGSNSSDLASAFRAMRLI